MQRRPLSKSLTARPRRAASLRGDDDAERDIEVRTPARGNATD
jgi:hypothetical protein